MDTTKEPNVSFVEWKSRITCGMPGANIEEPRGLPWKPVLAGNSPSPNNKEVWYLVKRLT
jgi:hypothetical protein